MSCSRAEVREVVRPHAVRTVGPEDFVVGERSALGCAELLTDRRWSLYCFDLERQEALFVDCPEDARIEEAAFLYQAQAEHAKAVVRMPFTTFHELSREIPQKPLIWVHSVGRCGSTLMSKALATFPDVLSLSEPDDLTQMLQFDRAIVPPLMSGSVKWRCNTDASRVALKTRSEVVIMADIIADLFPDAKHLFLYRNGLDWMRTLFRGFPGDRLTGDPVKNRQMEEGWARILPMIAEYRREDVYMNPVQVRMLAWISCMEGYLRLVERGLDTMAVRYEDLRQQPQAALAKVFDFCGIYSVDWSAVEEVLGKDSQAGTIYDREQRYKMQRELPDDLIKDVLDIVATRPNLKAPDVVVPRTVEL